MTFSWARFVYLIQGDDGDVEHMSYEEMEKKGKGNSRRKG